MEAAHGNSASTRGSSASDDKKQREKPQKIDIQCDKLESSQSASGFEILQIMILHKGAARVCLSAVFERVAEEEMDVISASASHQENAVHYSLSVKARSGYYPTEVSNLRRKLRVALESQST
eukprot:TRINITY_DN1632_c0_g1_i1.p1 TRINITY_DN1632_c0_g1~~TRINITY_DN1632_c0_g1_i1.p1  ORF type:complete len:138 (-),score=10.61 TRINITY_DN1632_c0_g1_i1:160-525(-)